MEPRTAKTVFDLIDSRYQHYVVLALDDAYLQLADLEHRSRERKMCKPDTDTWVRSRSALGHDFTHVTIHVYPMRGTNSAGLMINGELAMLDETLIDFLVHNLTMIRDAEQLDEEPEPEQ